MDWLYQNVADMWSAWLPEDAMDTIKLGGFYSHSPVPGLRVVSLNMNYCNTLNWSVACFQSTYIRLEYSYLR